MFSWSGWREGEEGKEGSGDSLGVGPSLLSTGSIFEEQARISILKTGLRNKS
jgi:hypothetical protein